MQNIRKIIIVALTLIPLFLAGADIYLAGDSTCTGYRITPTICGWGVYLNKFTNPGVQVHNFARSGTTTRSFRKHFWNRILAKVQPGDFIFIQFGHNDGGKAQIDPDGEYQDNLRLCIKEARAQKAIPVLMTQTPYCEFRDGKAKNRDYQQRYIDAVRKVAREEKVDLIDHNQIMAEKITALGFEKAKKMYSVRANGNLDKCHLSHPGAEFFAGGAAEYALKHKIAAAKLFKAGK